MGMTITEKILSKAAGKQAVQAGEIIIAKVSKAMMDDILGPRMQIADQLKEIGAKYGILQSHHNF